MMSFTSISLGDTIAALAGVTVLITYLWNGIGKPNKRQDIRIQQLDNYIEAIKEDLKLIKVNHLSHMEKDINGLREGMVRIETVLEERLPHR